jgi:hypothetical protein
MMETARLRRVLLGAAIVVGAGAAGLFRISSGRADVPAPQPGVPPADDPAAVLARHLDTVLDGPNAGLILFIARYPDEPLTARARAALATRRMPDPQPDPGPDGEVIAAFDRARLAGPAALAAFARTWSTHPLGMEALRPEWR